MAELTPLDEKLGEVLGLAQAAQEATAKVAGMEGADEFRQRLDQMREEAAETERRTDALIDSFDGRKTAIRDKAADTKGEAKEMMQTYLAEEEEALDGFEFLAMAEAGELGHWEIVQTMGETVGDDRASQLAAWAVASSASTSRPYARAASSWPPPRRVNNGSPHGRWADAYESNQRQASWQRRQGSRKGQGGGVARPQGEGEGRREAGQGRAQEQEGPPEGPAQVDGGRVSLRAARARGGWRAPPRRPGSPRGARACRGSAHRRAPCRAGAPARRSGRAPRSIDRRSARDRRGRAAAGADRPVGGGRCSP